MKALLDGYCRESVSSFASAQERFHEFAIKVFLTKQGAPKDQFFATWKLVANQSERQLGAYYFLHLLYFRKTPTQNTKMTEFRNSVIHKGSIPSNKSRTQPPAK